MIDDDSLKAPDDCPACGGTGFSEGSYLGKEWIVDEQPCEVCGGDVPNMPIELIEELKEVPIKDE